jgi:hypothetical protein
MTVNLQLGTDRPVRRHQWQFFVVGIPEVHWTETFGSALKLKYCLGPTFRPGLTDRALVEPAIYHPLLFGLLTLGLATVQTPGQQTKMKMKMKIEGSVSGPVMPHVRQQ